MKSGCWKISAAACAAACFLLVLCFCGVRASTQAQSRAVQVKSSLTRHGGDRLPLEAKAAYKKNIERATEEGSTAASAKQGSARPLSYRRSSSLAGIGPGLSSAALVALLGAVMSALLSAGSASQRHHDNDAPALSMSSVAGLPTKSLNKLLVGAIVLGVIASSFAAPPGGQYVSKEKFDRYQKHFKVWKETAGENPTANQFAGYMKKVHGVTDINAYIVAAGLLKETQLRIYDEGAVDFTVNGKRHRFEFPEVVDKVLRETGQIEDVLKALKEPPQLVRVGGRFRWEWGWKGDGVKQSFLGRRVSNNLDVAVYLPEDVEGCFWDEGGPTEEGKQWQQSLDTFFRSLELRAPAYTEGGERTSVPPAVRIYNPDGTSTVEIGSGWSTGELTERQVSTFGCPAKRTEYAEKFKDGQKAVEFPLRDNLTVRMHLTSDIEKELSFRASFLVEHLKQKPTLPSGREEHGEWGKKEKSATWSVQTESATYDVHLFSSVPGNLSEQSKTDLRALLERTLVMVEDNGSV